MTTRPRDIDRGYTGPSRTWPEEDAAKLLLLELRADIERREERRNKKRARKEARGKGGVR